MTEIAGASTVHSVVQPLGTWEESSCPWKPNSQLDKLEQIVLLSFLAPVVFHEPEEDSSLTISFKL
jgi:hypothetical protein